MRQSHRFITFFSAVTFAFAPVSQADDQTELAKHMEEVNAAYKQLRRAEDPVKGAELARMGQREILAGLAYEPELFAEIPDGETKAKMAANYRRMMGENYLLFCKIEIAFLNNDLETVAALAKEMRQLKKDAHREFIKDE